MRRDLGCVLGALLALGCADPCSDVAGRLAGASAGEVVAIGACTIEGPLTVPAGVTLAGEGAAVSRVATPDGAPGVTLEGGATLRGLTVEGGSLPAIAGEGAVTIEDVEVRAERGVGVRIVGAGGRLTRLSVIGPVTEANATGVPVGAGPDVTLTHGIVLSGAEVSLADVDVTGVGGVAVLAIDSAVSWVGGSARGNLALGLRVAGGSVTLDGVELAETWEGVQPTPAYAAVFSDTDVTTDGLAVLDNDGLGLLHDGGAITHGALTARGNGDAALWVQRGRTLEVRDAAIEQNRLVGVFVARTPVASVVGSRIADTSLGPRAADTGSIDVGDGLEALLDPGDAFTVDGVDLVGNERVGAIFDLTAAGVTPPTLSEVSADGPTEAYGVVAQELGTPVALDESAITRSGGPAANDPSFDGLPVLGIIGPMFIPPAE